MENYRKYPVDTESDIVIGVSNLSLDPKRLARGNPGEYGEFLYQTKYDGFEETPVRTLGRGVLPRMRLSSHQSWFSAMTPEMMHNLATNPKRFGAQVIAACAMPRIGESMRRIKENAEQDERIVVYPLSGKRQEYFGLNYNKPEYRGLRTLFQPTVGVMEDEWGFSPVAERPTEEVIEEMLSRMALEGLKGICLDTHHWSNPGRDNRENVPYQDAIPLMVPKIDEMHLGFARVDTKGDLSDLQKAAKGAVEQTVAGKMIATLLDELEPGQAPPPMIVELPHKGIKGATIEKSNGEPYSDYDGVHRDLQGNLRAFVEARRKKPTSA